MKKCLKSLINYIDKKKNFYEAFWTFLGCSDDENGFASLQKVIDNMKLVESQEEMTHFLQLIMNIASYHHNENNINNKIINIIEYYKDKINQTFSDIEIFEIFQNNKLILLYLFENQIIKFSDSIFQKIVNINEPNKTRYCHFFYPEIIKFIADEDEIIQIEQELLTINSDILVRFEENRKEGQNESYICSLIREELVEKFIEYHNRSCCSLTSQVKYSIFETNHFLIENKNTTLIEYAAFFGSLQIIRYIQMNNVELTPSLWIYAIHSNNAEIIHFLEEFNVKPSFEACLVEAIKCHHNDIANYFIDNKMSKFEMNENLFSTILKYHNYAYLPTDISGKYEMYYLCYFNYRTLSRLFFKDKGNDADEFYNSCNNGKISQKEFLKEHNKIDKITFPFSIVSISTKAFYELKSLRQVFIPSSITFIGEEAFCYCKNLEKITFEKESSLKTIKCATFKECTSLKHIEIPSSVNKIEQDAFSRCNSLLSISFDIHSSISCIEMNTFYLCSLLSYITIPSSVAKIDDFAFFDCSSLKKIIFQRPSLISSIGNSSFCLCASLTELLIPSTVKFIGKSTFSACSSLVKVIFEDPSSITSLGDYAFCRCSSLIEINFPSSVVSIGRYVFSGCPKLDKKNIKSMKI